MQATSGAGVGRDLDEAVLAAVNPSINSAAAGLVQTISLSFACENLPNLDTFTRTDGMLVFHRKVGSQWQRIGMTEVIMDNLNPSWVTSFDVQYNFERRELYKVDVYDIDDTSRLTNFSGHDYAGSLEFSIHEVVTARDQTLVKNLVNTARAEGASGIIKITGEERNVGSQEEVQMKMRATFPAMGGYNFFLIHKQLAGNNKWKPIYKSEIKQSSHGYFEWDQVNILSSDLTGDDIEREIRIDFFISQKSGKHKHCGQTTMTLAQIKENMREYQITDKKMRALGNHMLTFTKLETTQRHTFLEYVFGGCEIGLNIAIDFTGSNGRPESTSSLHYHGDLQRNEYLKAIKSVGNILQYYDSDKQVPVLGYGAQINGGQHDTSHCFAVNGNIYDPECDGIDGVVEAYENAIKKLRLAGPTNFSPIIKLVNEMTESMQCSQNDQKYNILLIITDGQITDMQETIDEIVYGTELPLSIIIVGVGNANFDAMDVLDADEVPLYSHRYQKKMAADIVQFVPFRKFQNNPMMLAKETLEEVPGQVLDYFRRRGITPNPATEAQKRALQSKLSQQRSLGGANAEEQKTDFWAQKKEEFLQRMQ